MTHPGDRNVEERLAALEADVAALRRSLGQQERDGHAPRPAPAEPSAAAESLWSRRPRFLDDGSWLNKLGIALLLFGVAFLFKYSIDQGWLTPWVRVAFGVVLAAGLLAMAARLPEARRAFARVLSGGAIATLYITIFAAFQLYALVPHSWAFALMMATTLGSFTLAVRQDEAIHSLIGTIGGFATPFLLYTGESNPTALVVYASIVLAGATAIFVRQGWRALLWVAAAGIACVLGIALDALRDDPATGERAVVQAGVAFAAFCGWVVPVVRERLSAEAPERWPVTVIGFGSDRRSARPFWPHPHMMVLTTAVMTQIYSATTWQWDETEAGWLAVGLAITWLAAAGVLRRLGERDGLVESHALAASILATLATALLLDGDVLLLVLSAEAAAFHLLAQRHHSSGPELLGHGLFFFIGFWLFDRLEDGIPQRPLLDGAAAAELFAVGAAGVAAFRMGTLRNLYLLAVHVGVLAWLLRELGDLANGQAFVTGAWVIYSVALLLIGLQRDSAGLQKAALATFLLIVVKLFLVDLDQVDPIWRILSFLGFGGILLALSYYFPTLWKQDGE